MKEIIEHLKQTKLDISQWRERLIADGKYCECVDNCMLRKMSEIDLLKDENGMYIMADNYLESLKELESIRNG